MSQNQNKNINRLNKIAYKALGQSHGQRLLFNKINRSKLNINFNKLIIDKSFVIGKDLNLSEKQQLFLNHLTYYIHFYRTAGAELIAIYNNKAIAKNLSEDHLKKYLLLEVAEEYDHIKTFKYLMHEFCENYQLSSNRIKNKFLNKLSYNDFINNMLIKIFGPQYMCSYFLARGVFNHLGYHFEKHIIPENNLIYEISKLHIIDEKRHTAVSHTFSQVLYDLFEAKENKLVNSIAHKIENQILRTSFNSHYNNKIEFNIAITFIKESNLFSIEEVNKLLEDLRNIYLIKHQDSKMSQASSQNIYKLIEESQIETQRKLYWINHLKQNKILAA